MKVVKATNSSIRSNNAPLISIYLYDYTSIVDNMLVKNEEECLEMLELPINKRLSEFKNRVTNDGPWDMKRKKQWRNQVGSVTWSSGLFPFMYHNDVINPEILGNITYGYWGKCVNFSNALLIVGGSIASIQANGAIDSSEDREAIMKGGDMYYNAHK